MISRHVLLNNNNRNTSLVYILEISSSEVLKTKSFGVIIDRDGQK